MRLLVFSNCELDHRLGSGRTRLAWSAGLRARGHEVEIVDTAALLGDDGTRSGRRLRIGWRALRWLMGHDLSRYDLIEFYGAEFWPATWWLSRRRPDKRPLLVAHTDGLELLGAERTAQANNGGAPRPTGPRAALARTLQRAETLAFSRPDGFVTGCELDRRYMQEHRLGNPARMEVIPLGLEPAFLDRPLLTTGRENSVAFLGSWIARKGTGPLVVATVPLLRERPDLRLDLLGVGEPAETVLAAFPAEFHPQINVEPRLSVPEIIGRLTHARVFFLPTEYEGFGLALAEAMACGCAAVTTPTGFGAELRDGQEALLCPFGAADAMRGAVARLLDDEALRARIAEAGWRRVQGLRWDTSVGRLETTYLRWLDEKGGIQKIEALATRHTSTFQSKVRLWFFASLALTGSMLTKEIVVAGAKGAFHWSYNLIMFGAALSLFLASRLVCRDERLFAFSGFLCFAVALIYLGLPTF